MFDCRPPLGGARSAVYSLSGDRGPSVQLSRWVYYADFVIYPLIVIGLTMGGLSMAERPSAWLAACLAALAAWTLIEYLLHRYVFHHVPIIERMHDAHHQNPRALIGSPVWLSFMIFAFGVFPTLWLAFGANLASAAGAGLVAGYLWYLVVHHAVHHWTIDERSWLYGARVRHLLHHYRSDQRSFGVTTGFWDYVFGTAPESQRAKPELPV